ncbi:uncharacterized protein [Montipora capricornis]|uniref:uncharacterized protein n=1 Tax=Montipora capricornis TaxID=246305 RepID=UPI0035F1B255
MAPAVLNVLNAKDYEEKCKSLLSDKKTYKPLVYNPTGGFKKTVNNFTSKVFSDGVIKADFKRELDHPSEPIVPKFYGCRRFINPNPFQLDPYLDPNINFTQENLTNDSLQFLDCPVTINEDGSLSTSVSRKPTHTDQYLQFDSHHPLIHKLGVIRTLEHRANVVISETAEREKEKAYIKSSLRKCGYPEWAFQKAGARNRQTNSTDRGYKGQGRTTKASITIPYVAGISEKIKNAFKAHGISACYKPWNTRRQKLVRVKDSVPKAKRANIVYGVKCGDKDC